MSIPKKHHFVPRTYLKAFTNENNKLTVFRKAAPHQPLKKSVNDVAFHKYYYSIPQDGGDNHKIMEEHFSEIETAWPDILDRIKNKKSLDELTDKFYTFICLQRIRVPAFRDSIELALAEIIKATSETLDMMGKLPPKPAGYPYILEHSEVAIAPYMSLKAMNDAIKGVANTIGYVMLSVLRNGTETPFVTSDNPVIYFDPTIPFEEVKPYVLCKERMDIFFLMPLAPQLMLVGISGVSIEQWGEKINYNTDAVNDLNVVDAINTEICRFAYNAVYSADQQIQETVAKYSEVSPVNKIVTIPQGKGYTTVSEMSFGKRTPKPKWGK